jgi:hypothetical protein
MFAGLKSDKLPGIRQISVETNMRKRMIIPIVIAAVYCAGCQSGRQEFNWKTFRFERLGPRDVYRPKAETGEPSTLEELGTMPPPGRSTTPELSGAGRQSAYERSQICRLYISRQPPKSFAEGEYSYVAKWAPVDRLSEILVLLYPAQGPGGDERIRYLLYRSENVMEKAKAMAVRLDVQAIGVNEARGDISTWNLALGLLYSSEFPRKIDVNRRAHVVALLNQVIENPTEDSHMRWAAALIAGHLEMMYSPQDYVLAGASFSRSLDFTSGPSYEGMASQYHMAKLLLVRHQRISAKKQAMDALNFYQKWESTECYERLRGIAVGND